MTQYLLLLIIVGTVYGHKLVDLTHTLDGNAVKWPLAGVSQSNSSFNYFKLLDLASDYFPGDGWWAINTVEFYEHLGTHIDAPYHGAANGQKLHEIPVERLIGPGVVIDVEEKAKTNPNYAVSVEDLLNYEETYGRIPPNAVVMMNSGWGLKYPNPKEVFGTDQPENVSTFNFPGFHEDACRFLLDQRQVGSVGVDTPSTDPGSLHGYPCHRYLLPNQIPLLEYVAHLDTIPCNETTIILGAIKHRGGTGGPTRVLALLQEEGDDPTGGAVKMTQRIQDLFAVVLLSVGTMFYTN